MDNTDIRADKSGLSPERAEGIQVEKPVPSWERLDRLRLDCKPHRGTFLTLTAAVNWCAIPLAWGPLAPFLGATLVMSLSLSVWVLARHDMVLMREGRMDRSGEILAIDAKRLSLPTFIAALAAFAWWTLFYLM